MNLADFRKSLVNEKTCFFHMLITILICLVINVSLQLGKGYLPHDSFTYQTLFHHVLTYFSALILWSVFIFAFYTYPQVRDSRILIAGFTFFTVGLLDGAVLLSALSDALLKPAYVLSQNMMLWFITQFFMIIGFSFLILAKKKPGRYIKRRYPALAGVVAAVISYTLSATVPFEQLFFVEKLGVTPVGKSILVIVIIAYFYVGYRTMKIYKASGDKLNTALVCAFLMMVINVITMMGSTCLYDFHNLLSLIYQFIAYLIFFYVFYIQSIKRPYVMLSKAQKELNDYLAELDELVDKRTTELRCMNEKLVADQEIARGMQMSMLPSALPHNEFVGFSSGYVPAERLSGDFYNVFKIDDARFGICVGDVSGHGVSAAMLSIFTFQKMQSLLEEAGGEGMAIPSLVLKHIYDSFNSGNFNDDMYIVMLYGVFNVQTGILSYASGGLNTTPLRIRPDGSIQELDNDGFAICKLGDLIKPKFVNHQILLFPGDKLVIYTDGLIDARNQSDEPYSLERLKKTILHHNKWGVDHLSEAIIKDVQSYTGNRTLDDITVVAMDVLPPF